MTNVLKSGKINYKAFHPRIIVKFNDLLDLPYGTNGEIHDFFLEGHVMAWPHLLEFFPGIHIGRLFTSVSPEKIKELVARAKELDPTYRPPNFLNFFVIDCPFVTDTNQLLEMLQKSKIVELAYVQSGPTPPPAVDASDDPYSVLQGYLDAGPDGIGARQAWSVNGGDGAGTVKLIDVEQGWADHEDIGNVTDRTLPNRGTGVIYDGLYADHGTS